MGSDQSRKAHLLQCPDDYDKDKFQKICSLFDKLDKDANLGVSSEELTNIAELHIKNCQVQLQKRLQAEKDSLERQLIGIEEKCTQGIEHIRRQAAAEKESTRQQSKYAQANTQSKIDKYATLDKDARENTFMKALMARDQTHIDFWTFFEYMKHRSADIANIEQDNTEQLEQDSN